MPELVFDERAEEGGHVLVEALVRVAEVCILGRVEDAAHTGQHQRHLQHPRPNQMPEKPARRLHDFVREWEAQKNGGRKDLLEHQTRRQRGKACGDARYIWLAPMLLESREVEEILSEGSLCCALVVIIKFPGQVIHSLGNLCPVDLMMQVDQRLAKACVGRNAATPCLHMLVRGVHRHPMPRDQIPNDNGCRARHARHAVHEDSAVRDAFVDEPEAGIERALYGLRWAVLDAHPQVCDPRMCCVFHIQCEIDHMCDLVDLQKRGVVGLDKIAQVQLVVDNAVQRVAVRVCPVFRCHPVSPASPSTSRLG
eukprot:m.201571 g.201571  ORF g.201571 m.201571 type:complete len:310 (-) comp53831_c1_seq2:41-970(-)